MRQSPWSPLIVGILQLICSLFGVKVETPKPHVGKDRRINISPFGQGQTKKFGSRSSYRHR